MHGVNSDLVLKMFFQGIEEPTLQKQPPFVLHRRGHIET